MKHIVFAMLLSLAASASAATPETAAQAVNAFGLDLHRQMPGSGNVCFSPYSIQAALGMTYLGASGVTQEEMARVLHFPADKAALGESFAALQAVLEEAQTNSAKQVARAKKYGGPAEALKLHVANRLFGQKSYEFRENFLTGVKKHFGAPMEFMDFVTNHAGATRTINGWVEKQTQKRILDLIPENALSEDTRLVLVNALYFRAAWAHQFKERAVEKPFHVNGGESTVPVPTMGQVTQMGYHKGRSFQAVALPYAGEDLHFLLIVPDSRDGVAEVEKELTPEILLECAKAGSREISLYLPKFKITPPALPLSSVLQTMGMKTAFDQPKGSADFDAMAPKKPDDYLCISEVFHKTFLELDEKGAEAAAATAAGVKLSIAFPGESEVPIELKADRPFLFAIQHELSGACLFWGRVSDPR